MPARIPVSAAAELGKKFGLQTVVLHCWDGTLQHIVSWGHTAVHCDYAAQAATLMEKAFEWPGMEERLPSRVRTLKADKEKLWVDLNAANAEVAKLKAQVAELNDRLHERTQNLLNELDEERRARQAGLAHWPAIPDGQNYPVMIESVAEDSERDGCEVRKPTRTERENEALLHRAGMCSHAIRQSAVDIGRCWTCQLSGLPVVVTVPS